MHAVQAARPRPSVLGGRSLADANGRRDPTGAACEQADSHPNGQSELCIANDIPFTAATQCHRAGRGVWRRGGRSSVHPELCRHQPTLKGHARGCCPKGGSAKGESLRGVTAPAWRRGGGKSAEAAEDVPGGCGRPSCMAQDGSPF
jgi:hypothetical protein